MRCRVVRYRDLIGQCAADRADPVGNQAMDLARLAVRFGVPDPDKYFFIGVRLSMGENKNRGVPSPSISLVAADPAAGSSGVDELLQHANENDGFLPVVEFRLPDCSFMEVLECFKRFEFCIIHKALQAANVVFEPVA